MRLCLGFAFQSRSNSVFVFLRKLRPGLCLGNFRAGFIVARNALLKEGDSKLCFGRMFAPLEGSFRKMANVEASPLVSERALAVEILLFTLQG